MISTGEIHPSVQGQILSNRAVSTRCHTVCFFHCNYQICFDERAFWHKDRSNYMEN